MTIKPTPWSPSSTWCPLDLEKWSQALHRTENPKILREKGFVAEIKRLLRPVNLAEPDAPIEVKSARIGEVKNTFYSFEPCLAFSKTEFSCSKTQTMGIPLQVRFCNVLGFVSGFHAVCLKIWSCFPHCIL